MEKQKHFEIIILSGHDQACRQFRINKGLVKAALSTTGSLLVMAGVLLTLFVRDGFVYTKLQATTAENQELRLANQRYHEASSEIDKKLQYFEEQSQKLAHLLGVSGEALGIGGAEALNLMQNGTLETTYFKPELDAYLREDLSLFGDKVELIEKNFSDAEEAYLTKRDLLDRVPSLLPANGWFASGFKYRKDPFTGKKTFHRGLDISCPTGTPVYAPANGVVTFRGYNGGLGNLLTLNHGNGIVTRYGHLWKFNVANGQRVKKGDLIAYVGNTGRSTGAHLHYEVHKDGQAVNPMKYIIDDVRPY
jgi:murein DD-endopeptidase MepM/ murein hydrolase activator NlpD